MAKQKERHGLSSEVQAILTATRRKNPELAIRILARRLLADFRAAFPDDLPPYNMEVLASFRSIGRSDERPALSEDAELAPDGKGGVVMRINRDRPRTRQASVSGTKSVIRSFRVMRRRFDAVRTQTEIGPTQRIALSVFATSRHQNFSFPVPGSMTM